MNDRSIYTEEELNLINNCSKEINLKIIDILQKYFPKPGSTEFNCIIDTIAMSTTIFITQYINFMLSDKEEREIALEKFMDSITGNAHNFIDCSKNNATANNLQ